LRPGQTLAVPAIASFVRLAVDLAASRPDQAAALA
jgi:hypothetical protein